MTSSLDSQAGDTSAARLRAKRAGVVGRDTLDDALIRRIAAGDREAMNVLYVRHSLRVYHFILRFGPSDAVAEELVNEVFFDVWRTAGRFEGRSQVSTWLMSIARNKAIAAVRRRPAEPLGHDVAELVEDPSDNAEAIADKRDTNSILVKCLAQLSPIHRDIIDLIYYRGKTINDVAAMIGIAQNTVKTRMFYARQRLAELLRANGVVAAVI